MNKQNTYLEYQGQTNQNPFLIDVDRADGIYIFDKE